MKPESKRYTATVGTRTVMFETGKLASQAGGAVTVGLGDSIIFAAATMGGIREGIDFFPLSVEYEERLYAGGKIPGSFFRREGRPSTDATLTARLTDRPLRPLFQHGMRNEVQVMMFSLSADADNPLDILAINAASAAIMISDIPWGGPVAAVRVGRVGGKFLVNPTFTEIDASDLDLRLAGTRDAILMVECAANEVPEEVMAEALELGHKAIQPLIDAQLKMAAEVGKPKREPTITVPDTALQQRVLERVSEPMNSLLDRPLTKNEFSSGMDALLEAVVGEMSTVSDGADRSGYPQDIAVKSAFGEAEHRIVRERILAVGKRPDGRAPKEVRPIWCEIGLSPRAHGSGLFTRGETQVLSLATLGTLGEAQRLDTLTPTDTKRYMHHYNFPPFSTGEVKPLRGQSRREVGHGALAERALEPVIPSEETFPYTIRIVSEVLSSNGSTSMASVCGSTLALMDAGVPIKAPVAGVAMGLVSDPTGRYRILTDIQGTEDHLGDMDFKVAGTAQGITALQMDIKVPNVTTALMEQALEQARLGRLFILSKMAEVLASPRAELSPYAPRIYTLTIPQDKIREVIGPGGKVIRGIIEQTGVKIDVEDDGTVHIFSADEAAANKALQMVSDIAAVAEVGKTYLGKVVRLVEFGAFVEIFPGTDGLLHISEVSENRIRNVRDELREGDQILVKVLALEGNKIKLSRRAVLKEQREKLKGGKG